MKPRVQKLKRGELDVVTVSYTKDDFTVIPERHRSYYLLVGQLVNEIMILQSMLLRSLHGIKGPIPVQDTNTGMALFFLRNICGHIARTHETINKPENSIIVSELWSLVRNPDAQLKIAKEASEQGKKSLNKRLGSSSGLMKLVRNKLAFHLDQEILEASFQGLPDDIELRDHHTGHHGTTFFNVADTAMANAVAHLLGHNDMSVAVHKLAAEATSSVTELQSFAEGLILLFHEVYFGMDRVRRGKRTRLNNLSAADRASIGFYMSIPPQRRIDQM